MSAIARIMIVASMGILNYPAAGQGRPADIGGRAMPAKGGVLAPQGPEAYGNLRALTPEQKAEQDLAFARAQRSAAEPSPFGPDYDPKAPVKPGFYGPPDMSQFPARFSEEAAKKSAEFKSEKISAKAYQQWAQDFFGRMADWKQKAGNDVPVPAPYDLPPMSE